MSLKKISWQTKGQSAVEYAVIAALVGSALIFIWKIFGPSYWQRIIDLNRQSLIIECSSNVLKVAKNIWKEMLVY